MYKIKQFFKKNERYLYLEYGVLSLLIMWPLLAKGYVLAMDMTWPAQFSFPQEVSNFYFIDIFLWLMNFILPSWLIQKFLIFAIFFCAGLFAHKLIKTQYQWPRYFVGFLYVLTPYLYSKFLYGQLWLCLAYALLPLLLSCLFELIQKINWKNLIKTLIIFVLIGFVGIHFVFISSILVALTILTGLIKLLVNHNYQKAKRLGLCCILLFLLFMVANSFWIGTFAKGENYAGQKLQLFDENQLELFKTDNGNTNVFFNVLSMYGFWGDRYGLYVSPKQFMPFWWFLALCFMGLATFGFIVSFVKKENRELTILGGLLFLLGTTLSVGIASETLKPLILWLNNNVPFYSGFREPQKFVALLMLGYLLLCSQALIFISVKLAKHKKENLLMIALVLVVLYNPLMFNGLRGQMYVSNYPIEWTQTKEVVDEELKTAAPEAKVLVFPWHLYMSYDFTRNKIVGPLACTYFGKQRTICGDNMELGNTYALTTRPISIFINELLADLPNEAESLNKKLEDFKVDYILVLKEVDWEKYDKLINTDFKLKLIFETNSTKLYKRQ